MRFKNYQVHTLFAALAMTFIVLAIVYDNFAFIGATMICLIFGVKKINHNNQSDSINDK